MEKPGKEINSEPNPGLTKAVCVLREREPRVTDTLIAPKVVLTGPVTANTRSHFTLIDI